MRYTVSRYVLRLAPRRRGGPPAQEWIRDDDFVPLRVWFVGDEKKKPGPTLLQDLLAGYLGGCA